MDNFEEVLVINAAKRLGLAHIPWMGDWFSGWSCRNENMNDEGSWHHYANFAAMILSHPATNIVAPELYRPDLKPDDNLYDGGNSLTEEQIKELFYPQG